MSASPVSGGPAFPRVEVEVSLTPQQIAAAYWEMDASEQADFFAELYRMAGVKLCFQTAAVFDEVVKRSGNGDHDAQNGLRTIADHFEDYPAASAEWRAWLAKREIRSLATREGATP